ncbi:MAG TPA: prepilin-type N-terminal cleavage/methylation domain-containing protein [Fimbriimonadaceae bacterium]|nr:prepilin-type N-terminal cleavage/methylation domain-containing protein [Fimbriimonadaceae bacterium]
MSRRAFTVIEVMIVVLIIGILLAIAIPNFLKARSAARQNTCVANQIEINNAKEIWAMDNRIAAGAGVNQADICPEYIKNWPVCPNGGFYTIHNVGVPSTCSIPSH